VAAGPSQAATITHTQIADYRIEIIRVPSNGQPAIRVSPPCGGIAATGEHSAARCLLLSGSTAGIFITLEGKRRRRFREMATSVKVAAATDRKSVRGVIAALSGETACRSALAADSLPHGTASPGGTGEPQIWCGGVNNLCKHFRASMFRAVAILVAHRAKSRAFRRRNLRLS
jgi:hypothetical protein